MPQNPETALAIAVLVLAPAAAWLGLRWLGWWERPLARLARRKWLAIWIAAAAPLVVRALLLAWYPIPEARVHDEFSFLLAADTFTHGRVVYPQHPFWVHFESMHILSRPVYASAFPIGQALVLAVGKVLFGQFWFGVWLSAGFMCGAICWMLQGWLPPRWALLGAVLVILRIAIASYWMNSYWGGCLAAAGGALVLGALPRIMRTPHWRYSVAMGVGLAILAHSRPFEGAVFGLTVAAVLVSKPAVLRRIILPLGLVLALTGAATAYYFARVTGKPWMAPYVLDRDTMTIAPHFIVQRPTPEPLYNNPEMRFFYTSSEMNDYLKARYSPLRELWNKVGAYWRFYFGPLLAIPLVSVLFLWRDRKSRQLLWMGAVFSLSLAGQVWHNEHYAAPATGLAILIVIAGMRRLRLWWWSGRPVGLCLVRCLPPACLIMLLIRIIAGPAPVGSTEARSWRWPSEGGVARARVLKQLESSGGKQLVFVRYTAAHDPGDEWVYNGADIDSSPVVWARELDRDSNARLMQYFAARRAWLVEPDLPSPRATPYREAPPRPMPFVQVGAPGIEMLRSPEHVRQEILEKAQAREGTLLSCDQWNFYFTQATGVDGPDVANGCFAGSDRGQPVSFERFFSWLRVQR